MAGVQPRPAGELSTALAAPTASDSGVRAGEPARPWAAWVVLACFFGAAVVDLVALLMGMWVSVRHFTDGALLQALVPTQLGDPIRILLVVAVWVIAVASCAAATIAGFYSWAGYGWSRWASLIAVAVGGLSFFGHWLAPWALLPLTVGAIVCWLPPMRRFHQAWQSVRHPAPVFPVLPDAVAYGPLPRYS